MGPFFDLGSLHKRQDEDNFLFGRLATRDVVIECQVFLHLIHEHVSFAPFSFEERGILSHGFDVCYCGDWLSCRSSGGCGSSSSWWSTSSGWSWRGSSRSSSSFSHGYI